MAHKIKEIMSKREVAKKAHAGKDMGKKNGPHTGFNAVAKAAGGGEKGKRIAAAQMWKMRKSGKL
jgi:hypothetical protein